MWLKAVPSIVECSHLHHVSAPLLPSSPVASSPRSKKCRIDPSLSLVVLPNPFVAKALFTSRNPTKISRGGTFRRSCSLNSGDIYHEESSFRDDGLPSEEVHYAASKSSPPFPDNKRDQDRFSHTRFDFLEPMMLGIRPEFSGRPDQEIIVWATIEQRAKSLDVPLSLRMIKKKLQSEEGLIDCNDSTSCSVRAAFASMVFIIVELQSHALRMRETLCDEDLAVITSKVQKEMHSSFVWLFQQVFPRTPALMLEVMILLADFGVCSASHIVAVAEASQLRPSIESSSDTIQHPLVQLVEEKMLPHISQELSVYQVDEVEDVAEMNLWNSLVDEAEKMQEGMVDEVLDADTKKYFVSPVSVEVEADQCQDYLRTDLLYQMNLSQEPDHPLLLCNYAQFLHLVAHDYDR